MHKSFIKIQQNKTTILDFLNLGQISFITKETIGKNKIIIKKSFCISNLKFLELDEILKKITEENYIY